MNSSNHGRNGFSPYDRVLRTLMKDADHPIYAPLKLPEIPSIQ